MAKEIELMPHQKLTKDFIVSRPRSGVFLGIGAAKTLSTLVALQELRPAGHILVVSTLTIARSTWLDEIEKWGMPLRTKSLIVDENDRPLTKEQRLAAFDEVLTDPPTMYFINQELLTRAPQRTRKLEAVAGSAVPSDPVQAAVMRRLMSQGPAPAAQVLDEARASLPALPNGRPVPKKAVADAIRQLRASGMARTGTFLCDHCGDARKGCRECRSGLIDRLPVDRVAVGRYPSGGIKYQDMLRWPFPTVVIDESQKFKNPSSERFKALVRASPAIERLIELTGTPSPEGLLDLWSQIYLLDGGAALGSFAKYRADYFVPTVHVDNRPVKWAIIPGMEEEIYKKISHLVMSAQNTTIPMPDVSVVDVNVSLPKDVLDDYREFAKEQVLELASPDPRDPSRLVVTADNAAILHGKLMQFASGTLYTDRNHSYRVVHTEKLEMLRHLVDSAEGNVLIGYRYVSEKKEIVKHLRDAGIDVQVFDGSRAMIKKWNDGLVKAMVLHPDSAGPGLNLQEGGHELIWYSLPDSLESYLQLNGRVARIGQSQPVIVYRMVTARTKDARQPEVLRRKEMVQQGLISAVEKDVTPYLMSIEDVLGDLDLSPL